ncbi:MAG: hypothetical protein JXA57_18015 [Armatimonadetes bacterium]|nr:hypothetical protein [Armatimonadota bacterium]
MRSLVAALFLVLLTGSSACFGEEAIELRFRPRVGEAHQYRLLIAGRLESSFGDEAEEAERGEVTARVEYTTKVVSKAENETLVETRSRLCEAKLSCGDTESTVQMTPFTQVARYDERHCITDLDEYDGGDVADCDEIPDDICGLPATFEIGCGMWSDVCDLLVLPNKAVKVGATWTHEEEWEYADAPHIRAYRLEALTTQQGRKCAKISVSWRTEYSSIPPDREDEEGFEMPSTDQLTTGEFMWYYDYENGVDVYVEGAKGTESTTPDWGWTTKMLMNVKIIPIE